MKRVKKGRLQVLQRSAIAEQLQSPLLQLPGELRNRIYELALSSEVPLVFHSGGYRKRSIFSVDAPTSPNEPVEFNQIKFTCRQLYIETACLESKSSQLTFRGRRISASPEPAQLFNKFLEATSVSKRSWLTQVTLDQISGCFGAINIIGNPSHLRPVAQFARSNPRARIDYTTCEFGSHNVDVMPGFLPMFTQTSRFMKTGIWLTHLARSIDLRGIIPAGKSYLPDEYMFYHHADQPNRRFEWLNVPNLKFWPGEKVLQENSERDLILDWATAEVAKVCAEYAKIWIKNGI